MKQIFLIIIKKIKIKFWLIEVEKKKKYEFLKFEIIIMMN